MRSPSVAMLELLPDNVEDPTSANPKSVRSFVDDSKGHRRQRNAVGVAVLCSCAWDVPHLASQIQLTLAQAHDLANPLTCHQTELNDAGYPGLRQSFPQLPNLIIAQYPVPWPRDCRSVHPINRVVV